MTAETNIVVALLKGAIEEKPFHLEEQEVSWETTEQILSFHRILNMAYRGWLQLENKDFIPGPLVKKMEHAYQKATVTEAHQHFALEEIRQAFESGGIDFVPLKGCVLKYLYPVPQMRSMCDLDILYKEEDMVSAARCLSGLGYEPHSSDEEQDIYFRHPFINLELHKIMLAQPETRRAYFDGIWDRVRPVAGTAHEYAMTLEDYYLYMLAHMAKHFFCGGTGLRSLADFHVFYHAKNGELNREVVNRQLEHLGLAQFEACLIDMDSCVFGGMEWPDAPLRFAFEYMLGSGIYGTRDNAHKNRLSGNKGSQKSPLLGKIQYLFQAIFPDRKSLELPYPCLKKHRYLLVPVWIHRLVTKMLFNRDKVAKRWSYVHLEDRELDKFQQIQKRAGL